MRRAAPAAQAPAPGAAAEPFRLPVSLNEVMVALVNHSADPIWLAAWRNPETDKDWRNAGADGVPAAGRRRSAGDSRQRSDGRRVDGRSAVDGLVEPARSRRRSSGKSGAARDLTRISSSGDEIVEICEGCHMAFKPDLPTSGMFGELSPTAADFEEEEADGTP